MHLPATLALAALTTTVAGCTTDLDCSLNGKCVTGSCSCDKPWKGPVCGVLGYKVTPFTAKNIYNSSDPRNTWNGPIVIGPDGKKAHIYVPIYKVGSLGGPTDILHGTADVVTGPWDWSKPTLPTQGGENPAFITYQDPKSGKTVYSMWMGGSVRLADNLDGPFVKVSNFTYPGGNPAPVLYKGAFYQTNQGTSEVTTHPPLQRAVRLRRPPSVLMCTPTNAQIFTTTSLAPGGLWTSFSKISHDNFPPSAEKYKVEDPFLVRLRNDLSACRPRSDTQNLTPNTLAPSAPSPSPVGPSHWRRWLKTTFRISLLVLGVSSLTFLSGSTAATTGTSSTTPTRIRST